MVVCVVLCSAGSVVVGALIGVMVGLESAWAASGENASNPTMATTPTREAGAAYRVLTSLRSVWAIYLSRNRQA